MTEQASTSHGFADPDPHADTPTSRPRDLSRHNDPSGAAQVDALANRSPIMAAGRRAAITGSSRRWLPGSPRLEPDVQ
jgi:hypothetical protein